MTKIPKLLQLARDNAAQPRALRSEESGDEATIYLHGVIGGWWGDIDATEFTKALTAIKASTIHLRINSPGGDVFDARAMMTAVKQHPAKVIAHIDGLAASAATDICMACDEREISKGAFFMLHNAWTIAIGDRFDMHEVGNLLEKVDNAITDDYMAVSKQEREQVTAWMDAETWFTADEAAEHGFVDRIVEVAGSAKNTWNLSAYANAPKIDDQPVPTFEAVRASLERRLRTFERKTEQPCSA